MEIGFSYPMAVFELCRPRPADRAIDRRPIVAITHVAVEGRFAPGRGLIGLGRRDGGSRHNSPSASHRRGKGADQFANEVAARRQMVKLVLRCASAPAVIERAYAPRSHSGGASYVEGLIARGHLDIGATIEWSPRRLSGRRRPLAGRQASRADRMR